MIPLRKDMDNGIDAAGQFFDELGVTNLDDFNDEAFHTLVMRVLKAAYPNEGDFGEPGIQWMIQNAIDDALKFAKKQNNHDFMQWHQIQIEGFITAILNGYWDAIPF